MQIWKMSVEPGRHVGIGSGSGIDLAFECGKKFFGDIGRVVRGKQRGVRDEIGDASGSRWPSPALGAFAPEPFGRRKTGCCGGLEEND